MAFLFLVSSPVRVHETESDNSKWLLKDTNHGKEMPHPSPLQKEREHGSKRISNILIIKNLTPALTSRPIGIFNKEDKK